MVTVETIGRIRRAFLVDKKPIRQIVRELRISRQTVRKAVRGSATEFHYERQVQPQPRLGAFVERLDAMLEANSKRPARERLTARRLFELLRAEGYEGAYDSVQRHVRDWRRRQSQLGPVFIPLWFAPGEAYQFDWSHEVVVLGGVTTTVKVAHVRLCHSRMPFLRAYPCETQEMVFDAHEHAFRLFGGMARRGIYDNMPTAIDAVFVGKERRFNRRFLRMCSHYLVEPVACTPAAGWEKGQVENQVGNAREHLFTPRLHFASYAELNAWLEARCLAQARESAHPEETDKTIWEVFEAERASLIDYCGPFDGFREIEVAVSKSSLVRFDHNRYSVAAKAARRTAQLPRVAALLRSALLAADLALIPAQPSPFDGWASAEMLALIAEARVFRPALRARFGLAGKREDVLQQRHAERQVMVRSRVWRGCRRRVRTRADRSAPPRRR
jgi:transposase